jgi:hypothetical protein
VSRGENGSSGFDNWCYLLSRARYAEVETALD